MFAEDFRRTAREALRGNWALAVGTGFVATLLGAVNGYSNSSNNRHEMSHESAIQFWPYISVITSIVIVLAIVSFFFGGAVQLGYCRFNKNLIDRANPRFTDLFSRFDIFWKAFGMQLLIWIFTILWSLLLIIPGIIASLSYAMTPYILEENPSMGILEAISASKEMMYGNKWRLFCLGFSFIGWAFLCLFTLGIGYLWLSPYINASYAAFYNEISGKNNLSEVVMDNNF